MHVFKSYFLAASKIKANISETNTSHKNTLYKIVRMFVGEGSFLYEKYI